HFDSFIDYFFTQSAKGVPSSANWNPTNPLRSRNQHVADISPRWTPVKCYTVRGASICLIRQKRAIANGYLQDIIEWLLWTYRIYVARGGNDTRNQEKVHDGHQGVKVKEHDDLLSSYVTGYHREDCASASAHCHSCTA